MLLALTSVSRCSEIRHLDIRFYTKFEKKFCFNVIKPTKTSKANKPLPVLEFECFQDDNNICVFETSEDHIFRAKPWREKSNHNKLLLSHIEAHSAMKACTLSRWICQVPKYAGITLKCLRHILLGQLLLRKLKHWVCRQPNSPKGSVVQRINMAKIL